MAHGQKVVRENITSEQANKWWLVKTTNEESGENDVDYQAYRTYQDNNNDYQDNTEPACTHPSVGLAIDTTS